MGRRGFTDALAVQYGLPVDRYPNTKEELETAEDALAADLANLSLIDQEKILFAIHGLPTTLGGGGGEDDIDNSNDDDDDGNDNDENDSSSSADDEASRVSSLQDERKLKAVEDELRNIVDDRKSAYELAMYLNPEYVQGREFQLSFLRCCENDPALAADQIVQHFATKQKLFGSGDVLGRGLLFSDLTPGAVKWLESGCFQILPSRDAAGRVVLFSAAAFAPKGLNLDDMSRAHWYLEQVITTGDESVTRDGIIMIEYNIGSYAAIMDMDEIEHFYKYSIDGCRTKVAAGHCCFDDPNMVSYLAGSTLVLDEANRHRMRPHYGSAADCLFKLQTFGIPTHDFPINAENTLELSWHREWLACQKKRESVGSGPAMKSILVPRRFDVLFGRGESTRVHTGNLRAVHLVEMHFEEYEAAGRREKTTIANVVVQKILDSYGRFLKWEEGGWIEVDLDTARNKVSHFFRRRRARAEKEKKISSSSSESSETETKKTERPTEEDEQHCSVVKKRLR